MRFSCLQKKSFRQFFSSISSSQSGQGTLLSVIAMGVFLVVVISIASQYSYDLARLSQRSRDNLLIQAVIEDIGVELRRAFEVARATSNTCEFTPGNFYGTAFTVGGLSLCLKGPGQICIQRSDTSRTYCAAYALMTTAKNKSGGDEMFLDARVQKIQSLRERAQDFLENGSRALLQMRLIPEARAQKSERYRPPLPAAASTNNVLNPVVNSLAMQCRTGPPVPGATVVDCITVRICDSGLDCTQDKNIITHRYAMRVL